MDFAAHIDIHPNVATALVARKPVVALESTLIAHGLPWPVNLETALASEAAIREQGAMPATIAVWQGRPTIGLENVQIEALARSQEVLKASRRDLAIAVAQKKTAVTTVSATLWLAHRAGIQVFATGGIGGAHRHPGEWDISADLAELARIPVAVVCAGAKAILDIPRTLEILETWGVPVIGYDTSEFPAFYVRSSGHPVAARVNNPLEAAVLLKAHWSLGGAGVVLAQPIASDLALDPEEFETALRQAEAAAAAGNVRGPSLTPFLLTTVAELTQGTSLQANQALIIANARLAAQVAAVLA
jgi:pseudouridine-5'-phosphate glycosidase